MLTENPIIYPLWINFNYLAVFIPYFRISFHRSQRLLNSSSFIFLAWKWADSECIKPSDKMRNRSYFSVKMLAFWLDKMLTRATFGPQGLESLADVM